MSFGSYFQGMEQQNSSSGGTVEARNQVQAYCDPVTLERRPVEVYGGHQPHALSPLGQDGASVIIFEYGRTEADAEWKILKRALDEDRLSDRALFP